MRLKADGGEKGADWMICVDADSNDDLDIDGQQPFTNTKRSQAI